MATIWFTSDEHYNHENAIVFFNRPFTSAEEMNEALVDNHNALVTADDQVYHLGNFIWHSPVGILERLNGSHYCIKGNHDKFVHKLPFKLVKNTLKIKVGEQHIWLSHYPHLDWPGADYGAWHLHGYSRKITAPIGRSCNVSVDAWGYAPVNIDTLAVKFKDIPFVDGHSIELYHGACVISPECS